MPVGRRWTRKTNRRLARIRLQRPGALPGVEADSRYTPREARKVRRTDRRMRAKAQQKAAARPAPQPKPYNPLAPLTGAREREEMSAAERLEFGGREEAHRRSVGSQAQTQANTGTYYDDYRQALREATARVNEANRVNVEATEKRIDAAYQEDKAGVEARDKAASETAAKLGRGPVQTEEGSRAVEAQRSQANQAAARLRGLSGADTRYMESRGATASLAKAQAMAREDARARELRREGTRLEEERGAFRTDFRRKTRQDEREWAAIRKEFGLKEREFSFEKTQAQQDAKARAQAANAQKIVARIYASADKAGARAQIRVAKLQLKKGRISQRQYRTIVNEYRGLPTDKSVTFRYEGAGGKGKGGKGSKPKLQTWETDKVSDAVYSLRKHGAGVNERGKWLKKMQEAGLTLRLARVAWNRYAKRFNVDQPPLAKGPGGQIRPR